MQRAQLEHVIAAAANVAGEDEFIVIGSQAILGPHPDAPETLLRSIEVDIYPLENPDKADEIDGALGDGSQFHRSHGYYAHGVGPETAKAPDGWQGRLVKVSIAARPASRRRPVALCLEPHDLVLAKCAASRARDWEFAREALKAGLVEAEELLNRIDQMPVERPKQAHIRAMLNGIVKNLQHVAGGDATPSAASPQQVQRHPANGEMTASEAIEDDRSEP